MNEENEDIVKLMSKTLLSLRGLTEAAKAFRENPNDGALDDRLTAWLADAEVASKLWETKEGK
jgi:hypothetical protein